MNIAQTKPRLPFLRPTLLAPMEGVTHPVFRNLIAEIGPPGCVCTEFVRITSEPPRPAALAREVVRTPGIPLSVQVMGRDLDAMRSAAEILDRAGADAIDINMGCPTRKAVKGGVGAAMLRDPELLYRVVSHMRHAVQGFLSAKIRAGFDDASRVVELAKIVEAAGVDYIAVHPRTRADHYRGVADWRIIKTLKDSLSVPVIGNGDAWYAVDALRMMQETGCDAVMIGRPALRNPWIFRQIDELERGVSAFRPNGTDVLAFLEHVTAVYRAEFGGAALGRLKELIRWLGRTVDDNREFRKRVLRTQSLEEFLRTCRTTLASLDSSALDLDAGGTLALESSGSCADSSDQNQTRVQIRSVGGSRA
ncbi:MAG: tRNA-dihydrouridine synthase family protein [Myxococcota bacterium]